MSLIFDYFMSEKELPPPAPAESVEATESEASEEELPTEEELNEHISKTVKYILVLTIHRSIHQGPLMSIVC